MIVSANLAPATPPVGVAHRPRDQRKPSTIPEQNGEPTADYIVRLKPDCPVGQVVILGQSIPKYMIHPDASLVENKGKYEYRMPRFLVLKLTDRQKNEIVERAKKTSISVPSHRDFNDLKSEKRVPAYFGYAIDWLIIEPVMQGQQIHIEMPDKEDPPQIDAITDLATEMVKQQAEKGEDKKGKNRGSK